MGNSEGLDLNFDVCAYLVDTFSISFLMEMLRLALTYKICHWEQNVVLKLISIVPKPEMHKIYFDDFISS